MIELSAALKGESDVATPGAFNECTCRGYNAESTLHSVTVLLLQLLLHKRYNMKNEMHDDV